MNSVRDLSKDKDIIRIIGGMPDRVLDKDAESEGADILDRIYEIHIGTQGTLIKMLQKAGYKVTESDSYTAVIIGNTSGMKGSRGYMYLFYTNDDSEVFPTVRELARRLKAVAAQEALTDENADYFDWKEYGSLEKQREYFSEIVLKALKS